MKSSPVLIGSVLGSISSVKSRNLLTAIDGSSVLCITSCIESCNVLCKGRVEEAVTSPFVVVLCKVSCNGEAMSSCNAKGGVGEGGEEGGEDEGVVMQVSCKGGRHVLEASCSPRGGVSDNALSVTWLHCSSGLVA